MNNRGPSGGPPAGHAPAGPGRKREYNSAFPDQGGCLELDAESFILCDMTAHNWLCILYSMLCYLLTLRKLAVNGHAAACMGVCMSHSA